MEHPLFSLKMDRGVLSREYRAYQEGALVLFLAFFGLLGLRLGPWGRTDGIQCLGEAVAYRCLTRGKIGFVLTELCAFIG